MLSNIVKPQTGPQLHNLSQVLICPLICQATKHSSRYTVCQPHCHCRICHMSSLLINHRQVRDVLQAKLLFAMTW